MSDKALKAGLDLSLPDSGAGTATLNIFDSKGLPTSLPAGIIPEWSSSDPAIVVTPAADGLTAQFAPVDPPKLATGVVISVTATIPGTGGVPDKVLQASGTPIDVVAGGPDSFQMIESVNA